MEKNFKKRIKEFDINYNQENGIVFYMDFEMNIIKGEVLFKGGVDKCYICAKMLFRRALEHNADSVVLAHNHPKNKEHPGKENLEPSNSDMANFQHLAFLGELLGIRVASEYIFDEDEIVPMLLSDDFIKKCHENL